MTDVVTDPAIETGNATLTITDDALENILTVRATETNAENLALWLEVAGVVQGQYVYDMYFQPLADANDSHEITTVGELSVVVPKTSVDKVKGASLGMSTDGDSGMEITNPNKPATPSIPTLDVSKLDTEGDEFKIIAAVLEQQINPAIDSHGGKAELVGVEGDTAYIRMMGGCQGCAMSTATLKQGIEVAIQEAVPSIKNVMDVTDHATGENPYYQ